MHALEGLAVALPLLVLACLVMYCLIGPAFSRLNEKTDGRMASQAANMGCSTLLVLPVFLLLLLALAVATLAMFNWPASS